MTGLSWCVRHELAMCNRIVDENTRAEILKGHVNFPDFATSSFMWAASLSPRLPHLPKSSIGSSPLTLFGGRVTFSETQEAEGSEVLPSGADPSTEQQTKCADN